LSRCFEGMRRIAAQRLPRQALATTPVFIEGD
jgi:hypothetical protein